MSYNKYTKYQIMDAKHNKNLINEELLVQKLPFKVIDPQPPKWFKEFAEKQDKVNTTIFDFMEKQDKVNKTIFDFMEKQNNINLMLIQRIEELENKFENEQPKWFKEFVNKQDEFNQYVRDVFKRNKLE